MVEVVVLYISVSFVVLFCAVRYSTSCKTKTKFCVEMVGFH